MQFRNTSWAWNTRKLSQKYQTLSKGEIVKQSTKMKLHGLCFNKSHEIQNLYFSVNSMITFIYHLILTMAKSRQEMPLKVNSVQIQLFIRPDN